MKFIHLTSFLLSFAWCTQAFHNIVYLPSGGMVIHSRRSTSSSDSLPSIVVDVSGPSTFRLGVRFNGWNEAAISSPSINSSAIPAPSSPVSFGNFVGIQTSFGSLVASADGSGYWMLLDSSNNTLVSGSAPPSQNNGSTKYDPGIILPVNGTSASNGPSRPCLGNGMFGPPFYYNRDANYLSFAVSNWFYDPDFPHCYPVSFSGSIGNTRENENVKDTDFCDPSLRHNGYDVSNSNRSPKYPNGLQNTTYDTCCAACNGDNACIGFVWSDGTRPDPTGNCWPLASYDELVPSSGRDFGGNGPPPAQQAWWAMGLAADWYLAPVATPLNFTRVFYELSGAPAVLPRTGYGFMATYWGYDNMIEVEANATAFRDGQYPIDLTIMDYDWFMANDQNIDFGYDTVMFGNHTFIHPSNSTVPNATTNGPVELFQHFHEDIHIHFGGIRKPRTYSNLNISNSSGWLLPDSFSVGAGNNNWNYSIDALREWYTANHLHFIQDGLDTFWLDEGETQWFTYTWWNQALTQVYNTVKPNQRHFTINRSFQPGMQSQPAITWTGDRQDCSHSTILQFTVAGQLNTACDMTSPDATVLVRQYWNAVFMPIMRVHQMHGTPRFPFLWGGAEHQAAFRAALNTRYHFIPHIYSLAHRARFTGMPIVLPASYIFPNDPNFPVAIGDNTYMFSDTLLPADVSTANNYDPNENTTHVNIPSGIWYNFNSTSSVQGPITNLTYTDVPLDQLVLFVRAGAILTLNKQVVQYTDLLGGDLEVQVYAGADSTFTLVEDDGISLDYTNDYDSATRRTVFTWTDATRTLSWTITGTFSSGNNLYTTAWPVLFVSNASTPVYHNSVPLGTAGSITFSS